MSTPRECDAFVVRADLGGEREGPLAGLRFAVKDNYDVAGFVTGGGQPDWAAGREAARTHADAVARLLAAGARFVGKTTMDELAYGVLGVNGRVGTPRNPRAPERVPGGSSSGSAVAVAAGDAELALGSDTACSIRIPGALCGLFALRPTHGRVETCGMLPLAPSLDTVGWLSSELGTLEAAGRVLLDGRAREVPWRRVLRADDALALCAPAVRAACDPWLERLARAVAPPEPFVFGAPDTPIGLFWHCVWRLQVREVWSHYGAWIEERRPDSEVLTPANFEEASAATPEQDASARAAFEGLRAHLRSVVPEGCVVAFPTVVGPAPRRDVEESDRVGFTLPSLCLCSAAGAGGFPQLQIPVGEVDGAPVGLSLLGPAGSDEALLALAARLVS